MSPRQVAWLDLHGVVNMRDLGGLPVGDGGTVRRGRLIRSDNLQDLTDGDVAALQELGLTDVVDLRSAREIEREGPGPLRTSGRVLHHEHSLIREARSEPGIEQTLLVARERSDARDPAYWTHHYLGYLANRPESVVAALRVIAGAEGATIVHCAAGKDRTGTVVGLALAVAGVPNEVVVEDYVASAERTRQIMDRLSGRPTYRGLFGRPLEEQMPQAASMERLLETIDEQYGGPLAFLAGHGWGDEDTVALRRALVE